MNISAPNTNLIINTNKYDENKVKQIAEKAKAEDDKALLDACKEFEAIFTHMLLKTMRKTVPESGLIEKSTATEILEDLYDQEVSNAISNGENSLGIAQMLYEQMKRGY